MAKLSVYLPDVLYRRARAAGLPLSALMQRAVEEELERDPNRAWIAAVRERPPRYRGPVDAAALVDDVRDGFDA